MLLYELIQLLLKDPLQFVIAIIILVVPLLISITIHEWAHGYTAYKFGDPTPAMQGRLSFNPFAHLDPMGALMLFIIGIGWAKPVEINPNNIQDKFKLMLVALAGPASNFILAAIFILVLYFLVAAFSINPLANGIVIDGIKAVTVIMLMLIIKINLALGLFNLIPLPPLDGANALSNLLPDNLAEIYFRLAPFSLPILLVLMISGGISYIFDFALIIQKTLLIWIDSLFFNVL
ncbi:MAG TPA: site-2 protease family protein [Candidatus Gastranaerophilales bacterium]|nr:site-2 protease family protein [Candidatus Gastranaerophilales bacterium]